MVQMDADLPERTWTLDVRRRMLNGTLYDVLPYRFHQEHSPAGEYVSVTKRAPSIRSNIARLVVEDSVGLLFGEGRFPAIVCEDVETAEDMAELVKETGLNRVMLDAAIHGSIGSVVVHMRILSGRLFFDVLDTLFLTPEYDPVAPDTLIRVAEQYKVRGDVLREQGYTIADDDVLADFWFRREWDAAAETWFLPWRVKSVLPPAPPQPDPSRTVWHGLGFVPMVWIKNLPGGDGVDGLCTFRAAAETIVELDYLLSAGHRALMYQAAPRLVVKEPADQDGLRLGPGDALIVSEKGDAKMLEISGNASAAIVEYAAALRERALEAVHGNRSNADKLSAAQSGRALEMLHQGLIALADNLRASYGEYALLRLLKMVVAAAQKMPMTVEGRAVSFSDKPLSLRWGPWFTPTQSDKQAQAGTVVSLRNGGIMARETAVSVIADNYDIEDVAAEVAKIAADEAAADARTAAMAAAQVKATEVLPN